MKVTVGDAGCSETANPVSGNIAHLISSLEECSYHIVATVPRPERTADH